MQIILNNKNSLLFVLIAFLSSLFMTAPTAYADELGINAVNKKILIVYYSRSGNTGYVAQHIKGQIGGDIVQLETLDPYPSTYRATTTQAKQELEADYHPPLKTKISNLNSYDVIFIGSPNWWGTMSMPIRTFLYENNLSGKTLIPFITHEGSGLGRSVDDLHKFAPNSTILDGIAIRGGSAKNSSYLVEQWLTRIDLLK